jgi:hypothetical protein
LPVDLVDLSEKAIDAAEFSALDLLLDRLGDRVKRRLSWRQVRANSSKEAYDVLRALAARPAVDVEADAAAAKGDADFRQNERHKERVKTRQRERTRSAREISAALEAGRLLIDSKRREACRVDLKKFCETYFAGFFPLAWSPAHLVVIERIETAVLHGGLFAVAMPRGSGKTTLSVVAVVWSVLFGHRRSVVLFGATKEAAVDLMVIIKSILEGEDYPELVEDFPEVCVPCGEIEDKAIMCKGQMCGGKSTRMRWDADRVLLPRLEGSESSGACIRTRGLSGHLRGLVHKHAGRMIRPDYVILDDPQTDESAMSEEETKKRFKTIEKGVRGLAGPGQRIAGLMPCTVIEEHDLADKILSGSPGWAAERIPMLSDFDGVPEESADRWEELREIYSQEMNSEAYPKTNRYFAEHREAMEAGISHYWPERVEAGFVSAIQHAVCWYMTRPESFWSEAMQKPAGEDGSGRRSAERGRNSAEAARGAGEGVVPKGGEVLVAFYRRAALPPVLLRDGV